MNSKTALLIGLCAFGLYNWQAQAMDFEKIPDHQQVVDLPGIFDEIVLQGTLMYGNNPNAIEAGASDTEVYIQFNQSFGNVSISIYDALSNLIYHSNENTDVQSIFIIPINSPVEGTFILELNSINGDADGGFEHNND